MEIQKASIYGFGKWVHFEVDFSRGMCIYGENEAGKSTIHQFILFMLFGLPPKQRAFFQPRMGAQLGGRMTIYDERVGEFVIERLDHVKNGAATCYTPDGMEYDEAWLRDLLKGISLATYESIFSFSALDLNGITKMSEVELSEMILSIGLTGSTEIYHLEKHLENKLGDIFKPFGKKPKMNQQLEQLEKRYTTLQQYKENEATYREKKLKELQLEEQREECYAEWEKEKRNLSNLEKYKQVLPVLREYKQYDSQLSSYEKDMVFPENGINRLENVKARLLPLQSELAILKDNEKKYINKIEYLQSKLVNPDWYQAAEELAQDKENYFANQKELERVEHSIQSKKMEIEAELDRLNIGIQLEELMNISLPFHIEKAWTEIKRATEQITEEEEKLQDELQELKEERTALYHKLEVLEEHVLSDELVVELNEKLIHSREFDLVQRLQEEADQKQRTWKKRKQEKEKQSQILLFGSLVLAIIISVIGFLTTTDWLPIVGIIVLFFGVGQWILARRSFKEWDEWNVTSFSSIQSIYSKEEIQDAEIKLMNHHKHVEEMETWKERLEKNDLKRKMIREKVKDLEGKNQKVTNDRNTQIREYPFLQYVDTIYWPELFHTLKQLVTSSKVLVEKIKEREIIHGQMDLYKEKLNGFFKSNDWKLPNLVEDQIKELESFIKEQQEISGEQRQLANFLAANEEEQQEVMQRIVTFEKELQALFNLAKVETEEAFYQKARKIEERIQIKGARNKTYDQLERIFQNESWKVYLSSTETENDLEWEIKETEKNVKALQDRLIQIDKELAKLGSQLDMMESGTNYSDQLHQFELEQEEFNELAKKWAVLKVAKELLQQTKRNYQEKYLHEVLEKTSRYFESLTGGKYITVFPPSEKMGFLVETEDGLRFSVQELSKGTMDQLYVSLRIAIGQVLSEKNQLPFIIDDAFLHFDSVRTKRIIETIEEIATSRQVILFTCKEEVVLASGHLEKINLENSIRII